MNIKWSEHEAHGGSNIKFGGDVITFFNNSIHYFMSAEGVS